MAIRLKENLTRIMAERRLTLAALSKLSGVPRSSLHNWATSESQQKINIKHVQQLCAALKVPLHELVFSEPDPHEKREFGREVLKELFSGDLRVSIHKIEREKSN